MKKIKKKISPAQITGILLLSLAAAVFFISPPVAAVIAFLYILLCVLGCFFPHTNFLFEVISRGNTGKNYVALTFDDGPSEPVTRQVLELLDKYRVKATFFVSGVGALCYPEIIAEIIGRGHDIGNHSYSHNPFLMLKSCRALYREVAEGQKILKNMGVVAFAFRPPVGIVNPKLPKVLEKMDMLCVTFSCRAYDAGNVFVRNIGGRILSKIKADDIILLHDVPARTPRQTEIFLAQTEKILAGIGGKGLKIVPLSFLLGKDICRKADPA